MPDVIVNYDMPGILMRYKLLVIIDRRPLLLRLP